jgi:hypothetical protein
MKKTPQTSFDFASTSPPQPRYAVTEKTATPSADRIPEVNPLRLCYVSQRSSIDVAPLLEKFIKLERLRDGTTFQGEREAADAAASALREKIEQAIENDLPRKVVLCDGCALVLGHAIDGESDPRDGLKGFRVWKSLTASCERCWKSARRSKGSENERIRWSEDL